MEITYYKYKEKMPMKKFRFLIFMLVLTSIFIGCAQPTDDTVIPEVPKTTAEAEPTDDQLYSLAKVPPVNGNSNCFFYKNFTIKSSNRKFTINTTLLDNSKGLSIEYLNEEYVIKITSIPNYDLVNINANAEITDERAKTIITNNIKQIYVEVK